MEQKETYWSRFSKDFEEKNYYVVGKSDIELALNKVATLQNLKNVLELGCGNGTYSKVVAKNANSLLATDFSEEMVAASKKRLEKFPNIKVEKANCLDLSYVENSFDTIFMANLMHIISNPEIAIQECKRVLKNRGTLVVMSYTQKGMKPLHKIGMIYRYLKTYGKPPTGGKNFGLDEAVELLLAKGFQIAESELIGEKVKAFFVRAVKS